MDAHQIVITVVGIPVFAWCIHVLSSEVYAVVRAAYYGETVSKHIMEKEVKYLHQRINDLSDNLNDRLAALEKDKVR